VESFVDSQLFRGTCYKAQGWLLMGATKGFERVQQEYYVAHERPKQPWVRELDPGGHARAHLRAEQLPAELQAVEDRVIPRTTTTTAQIGSLWQLCRSAADWRKAKGKDYHLATVLAIIIMAVLCGIVRGQRDPAAFAAKLTPGPAARSAQLPWTRWTLPCPKETTFQRVLAQVDPATFERILHTWETQLLGPAEANQDQIIAIDGKAQCGSTPEVKNEQNPQLVSALSLPSGRVLGTVLVEAKSNEIPRRQSPLGNDRPRRRQAHHARRPSYEPSHPATDCSRKPKRLPMPRQRSPRRASAASAARAADSLRKTAARATRWPSPLRSPTAKATRTTAAQLRYRRKRGKKPHALREAQPGRRGQQS